MELHAHYTLIAEGARQLTNVSSCAKASTHKKVRHRWLKELGKSTRPSISSGLVMHSQGWPLGSHTGGGSFL